MSRRSVTYRSSDYTWNDHPSSTHLSNHPSRSDSLAKSKVSTSSRHYSNGLSHDSMANSMPHLPVSTVIPMGVHQHYKDDPNNGDSSVSSPAKTRHTSRNHRTNLSFDKTAGSNGYNLPMRVGSFSSRLDQPLYSRHGASKQRNYPSSKPSYHDTNTGDLYLNGVQDENTYYFQQQPSIMSSTQRLNGSTFDITTSRKPFLINKSNTFNNPANGTGQHMNYNSSQELHRSEFIAEKNHAIRGIVKGSTPKEQIIPSSKYRQTPIAPTGNLPNERQPSAQSHKSRDANTSYAYTNVKKYIEENELMSPEKEQSIRKWVYDVEKYRHQFDKIE